MKGLKWKHQLLSPLCLGLLISLFSTVFLTNSASAVQVTAPTIYWRAYTSNGNLTSEAWSNTNSLPKRILSYVTGEYRTLQGFTIDLAIQDTLNTRFKTLVTKARLQQTDAEGVIGSFDRKSLANPSGSHLNAGTSAGTKTGPGCTMQWIDKYTADYTCTVTLDDYSTIDYAQVTLGYAPTTTIHSDPVAILCGTSISPACAGNVVLYAFSYELTGTSSPTDNNVQIITAELGETNQHLSDINDTLEEQNERDQQDRDNLENQAQQTESDADSAQQDVESSTASIMSNITGIVGAFNTGPTDCVVSIQTGANGSLALNNMNLCSAPESVKNMIHNISSIVVTVSVLWVSYSVLRQFLDIYEAFLANGGIKH